MTSWIYGPQDTFVQKLKSALAIDLPYEDRVQERMLQQLQGELTPAAVLALVGYRAPHEPCLLFTRRTESVVTHKGQMAFPGGHTEPEDQHASVTALRETEEEVGIPRSMVQILGNLPQMVTVTKYLIQPFVGILHQPLEQIPLFLDSGETAEAIWIPFEVLLHPDTYRREHLAVGGAQYPIDVFLVSDYRIWGATGSMTKNLLDRLRSLG